jgi:hypothetical protein
MLLTRPEAAEKNVVNLVAQKAGMCNLPPYIFAQTIKSGTVYVGNNPDERQNTIPEKQTRSN